LCAKIELFQLKIGFLSLHLPLKRPDPQSQFSEQEPDPDPTGEVISDSDSDPEPTCHIISDRILLGKKFQIRANPDPQHWY